MNINTKVIIAAIKRATKNAGHEYQNGRMVGLNGVHFSNIAENVKGRGRNRYDLAFAFSINEHGQLVGSFGAKNMTTGSLQETRSLRGHQLRAQVMALCGKLGLGKRQGAMAIMFLDSITA